MTRLWHEIADITGFLIVITVLFVPWLVGAFLMLKSILDLLWWAVT